MTVAADPILEDREHIWRAALSSRNFVIGAVLTGFFVLLALTSFVWTPYNPATQDIPHKFAAPFTAAHWLGSDHFGRDTLSQIMVGARTSIAVALVAVGMGILFGTPLGLAAAARRVGLLDELIMRTNDLVFAFPALLIAILITAVFGPGAINAIIAIGIFNIPVFARLARGSALSLWQREFILAARVAGKGTVRISVEHILPNIMNTLIVQATIQFSLGILAEAALAYVGLGAQPPIPSWGKMLADAQTMAALAPHVALVPGLAIVFTVLGVNLMGDGLRDVFDPRLRRSRQ
jgi:peptide/nickel transport system permease protein